MLAVSNDTHWTQQLPLGQRLGFRRTGELHGPVGQLMGAFLCLLETLPMGPENDPAERKELDCPESLPRREEDWPFVLRGSPHNLFAHRGHLLEGPCPRQSLAPLVFDHFAEDVPLPIGMGHHLLQTGGLDLLGGDVEDNRILSETVVPHSQPVAILDEALFAYPAAEKELPQPLLYFCLCRHLRNAPLSVFLTPPPSTTPVPLQVPQSVPPSTRFGGLPPGA